MTVYDVPPKQELYEHYIGAGMTREWLAKHYHVSDSVIKRWLSMHNLKKKGTTDLVERAMHTLLHNGFSGREIALLFDTSHTKVYNSVRRYREKVRV